MPAGERSKIDSNLTRVAGHTLASAVVRACRHSGNTFCESVRIEKVIYLVQAGLISLCLFIPRRNIIDDDPSPKSMSD